MKSKEIQFILLWVTVILLFVIMTYHNHMRVKTQKRITYILIFFFAYIYSFRTLGLDINGYMKYYNDFSIANLEQILTFDSLFRNIYEPMFTAWVFISRYLGFSFAQSMFFYVLTPMFLVYRAIKNNTRYVLVAFSLFILQYMFYFDMIRMFFSLAIALNAFYSKNKLAKIALYLLAFLSHYSIVAMVFFELLSKSKILMRIPFLASLLIGFVGLFVFVFLISNLTNTGNRFVFKILYYFSGRAAVYDGFIHRILFTSITLYNLIMGLWFYRKHNNLGVKNDLSSDRVINMLKVGIVSSLVLLPISSLSAVARVILPAISPLFLYITELVAVNTGNAKIKIRAINAMSCFFIYDILMSAYYVWVSITY